MGRTSQRSVSVVAGIVGSVRVRASVAAILMILALVMPTPTPTLALSLVQLSGASASPTSGTTTTEFSFSVIYHNQGRVAPAYVRVYVGGSSHDMAATSSSTDWRSGVTFAVKTRLPVGTWHAQFESADAYGGTGALAGPTVTVQGPTPTPSPTPKPTPTPTPKPTATPTPTPAPTATPKPTASPTPKPTATPAPTATPRPTVTPTPKPTSTPAPTPKTTPAPTKKPNATPTSGPTARPTSAPTASPGSTSAAPGTSTAPPSAAPGSAADASPSPSSGIAVVLPPVGTNGSGSSGTNGQGGTGGTGGGSGNGTIDTPSGGGPAGRVATAPFGNPSAVAAVLARLMPTLILTTGAVAMMMAFLAFGRRHRDEAPTAPDAVLAAAAASGMSSVSGAGLVPGSRPAPAAVLAADATSVATAVRATVAPAAAGPVDSDIPRWRRRSLLEARKADPLRAVNTSVSLTFSGKAGEAVSGLERRRIRYRLVSLLDRPDDVRGIQIGSLDEGDEVVLVERLGTYWRVLCPDGREGWLHKMVLGAPVIDDMVPMDVPMAPGGPETPVGAVTTSGAGAPNPRPSTTWTSGDEGPAFGSFEDVLKMYSERRRLLSDD